MIVYGIREARSNGDTIIFNTLYRKKEQAYKDALDWAINWRKPGEYIEESKSADVSQIIMYSEDGLGVRILTIIGFDLI